MQRVSALTCPGRSVGVTTIVTCKGRALPTRHGWSGRAQPFGWPSNHGSDTLWRMAFRVRSGFVLAILTVASLAGLSSCAAAPPRAAGPSSTVRGSVTGTTSLLSPFTSVSTPDSPTSALPTVTIGGWTGREPAAIYFSGDAGDIVTGLTWSTWNQSEAVGEGMRNELSCVPNCAQGSATPYPATVTMSAPMNGQFTSIVEQTADGKGTTETFNSPYLGQGACTDSNQSSCAFS
jgi:hypothetical protein